MRDIERKARDWAEKTTGCSSEHVQVGDAYLGYLAGARSMLPEIEALEKRNAELRDALEKISRFTTVRDNSFRELNPYVLWIGAGAIDVARDALRADEGGGG